MKSKMFSKIKQENPIDVGSNIFLIDAPANFYTSIYLLKNNGLELTSFPEVLIIIEQNQQLKERLKGKTFYVENNWSRNCEVIESQLVTLHNTYKLSMHTLDDIEQGSYMGGNPETNISIWGWDQISIFNTDDNKAQIARMVLHVLTDKSSRSCGWRFELDKTLPMFNARSIVGSRDTIKPELEIKHALRYSK